MTSKWLYHTVLNVLNSVLENVRDTVAAMLRSNLHPRKSVALYSCKKAEYAESARKRFAFEGFYIQVQTRFPERKPTPPVRAALPRSQSTSQPSQNAFRLPDEKST